MQQKNIRSAGVPGGRENKQMSSWLEFRNVFDLLLEGVQIHDFNWRYIYVNDALVKYSKYSREELLGHTVMEKYPGIELTPLFKAMQRCMSGRLPEQLETNFVFPDGTSAHFELSIQPIPEGIFILSVDRSEQIRANEKLLTVNRLYTFISAINQSIVHITDERELLDNACKIALELGRFRMAWIGMFDKTDKKITLVGQGGIPSEYMQLFIDVPYQEPGPQDYILRNDNYYVCNHIEHDPELESWKAFAASHGIHSCIVLPIRKAGNIIGSFNLYATEAGFFDKEEIAMLLEVTGDISFALDLFEKIRKHKDTEDLVVSNEKRFRSLIEKSADMITLSTRDGEILYGSPSITQVFGYSVKEISHALAFNFIHPDDISDFLEKRNSILQTPGKSFYHQQRLRHKNGSWIWCEATITNLLHEPGIYALVANFRDISEKKMREQQREFDQYNLNALINNTNDLMWSVDKDFRLITSNQPFDALVKLMSGTSIAKGSNILAMGFPLEQLIRFKITYQRAFAGEAFTEIEHADNTANDVWSEISYYPIRKGDEVIGTACHSHDVTQIKRAEEKLKHSEKGLMDSQAIAHLGNWELSFATNTALWSAEACRIYGFLPWENMHTYETWLSFIHPDDRGHVMTANDEAKKTCSDTILNYRIILGDGTIRHIYSKSRFEFTQHGKPVGLYGIVHDITELKEAEQQLRKSESFNRGVLNSLSSHIAVVDMQGNIVAVNESWKRFAIENGETSLQRVSEGNNYFHVCEKSAGSGDDNAAKALQGMKDVILGKRSVFYLEYPCHSNDHQRWFVMRIMRFDSDEQMIVISHEDISERMLSAQMLIHKNEELQKTNAELDRFVYSASHDLRSPLTSILGLLSFIEEESRETNTLEHAGMIRTSINRLDEFIRKILSYSQNKRAGLEVEKILLKETINEILGSLLYMKNAEEIHFEVNINEQQPFYSDRQRFITIMENIISNAIKYHKEHGPGKFVKITGISGKKSLDLIVEDNGIGIAPAYQDKVFDMFFRLSGDKDGSGIGLYIVKETIEKLQGSIQISSKEGTGTSLTIKLMNLTP